MESNHTFITIVSGYPRSGTSLMMQMLEAGGLPVLCDDAFRPADERNPRGYYEIEAAMKLGAEGQTTDWVAGAQGKAVKVIAYQLRFLPPEFAYRVGLYAPPHRGNPGVQRRVQTFARGFAVERAPKDHYAFNGDYIGHRDITALDLGNYDIIIMNTNYPLLPLVRLAQDRPSSIKWVSLIEGSADEYFVPQNHLKTLLDLSDLVNVINRHSLLLFRMLTKSKAECIGIPYPVEGVKKFITPIEKRTRRVFLCTHLLKRWNDYLAAKDLGIPYYGYEIRKTREGKHLLSELINTGSIDWDREANIKKAKALYKDSSLDIHEFTKDFKKYFTENSDSYFWMNLDSRKKSLCCCKAL